MFIFYLIIAFIPVSYVMVRLMSFQFLFPVYLLIFLKCYYEMVHQDNKNEDGNIFKNIFTLKGCVKVVYVPYTRLYLKHYGEFIVRKIIQCVMRCE